MKRISLFALVLFYASSCREQTDVYPLAEGYVIGFDQCTVKGFVITANGGRDTLLTYNLPDSVTRFPAYAFTNALFSPLFPDSLRNKYRIAFSYRAAKDEEKVGGKIICKSNILIDSPVYKKPEMVIIQIKEFAIDK